MSKYLQRGCYHIQEFANPNTTYAKHVDDLVERLRAIIGMRNPTTAFEVGCGEGLILDQLHKRLEWVCEGMDIDDLAISLARRLNPMMRFHVGNNPDAFMDGDHDVALFCDVLEHVKDPCSFIETAMARGVLWIVIATPDRHDPHGEQDLPETFADATLSEWSIAHRATRYARHLTIWKRP